jgi:hypothetical protein
VASYFCRRRRKRVAELPLPVLPLHLHFTLGLSPVIVGVAVGAQFAAALLSRAWAGAG